MSELKQSELNFYCTDTLIFVQTSVAKAKYLIGKAHTKKTEGIHP
jgi:hypothetical protein